MNRAGPGRQSALPRVFAAVHPRFRTPGFSTSVIAGLAIVWYVPLNILSENFLYDTITALSLMIAFYYALTGLACAVYYRRELTKSLKNLLFIGVGPVVGGAILGYLFVKSAIDFYDVENSYTGQGVLGMGVPFVIGIGFMLLASSCWCSGASAGTSASSAAGRSRRSIRRSPGSRKHPPSLLQAGDRRVTLAS